MSAAVTVTTASTAILGYNQARRSALVQNLSAQDVYLGVAEAATIANGLKLAPNGVFTHDRPEPVAGIVAATTADVRVQEV